jgi:orotidine-5'-phosphate decarboxylase
MAMPDARDRLFVALDVPDAAAARALVERIGDAATAYKLGLELLFGGALGLINDLSRSHRTIFLDMKLLDIPNTVERAAANIAGLGVDYLTVHGIDRKTLDAAVRGRGQSQMKLLAVTVLTSLNADDLRQQGIADGRTPADLVLERARMARDAGFDGVIAAGTEAQAIRRLTGPGFLIVTPGIRRASDAAGDQARIVTPGRAIADGASHLVVGRPITAAGDPANAARAFATDIAEALMLRH